MEIYTYYYKNDFYPTINLNDYPDAVALTFEQYQMIINGTHTVINGEIVDKQTIQTEINFEQYKSDKIAFHKDWERQKYEIGIQVEVLPGVFDYFAALPDDMTKVTSGCVYVMLMSQVSPDTPLEVIATSTDGVDRILNGIEYVYYAKNYGAAYNELRKYVKDKLNQINLATTVEELDNIILD